MSDTRHNKKNKTIALLIVIFTCYFAVIGFEGPEIVKFTINWAYFMGMTAAVLLSFANRFIKWGADPEFKKDKLLRSHMLSYLLFCPLSLFIILPRLGASQGIWKEDFARAFFASYLVTNMSQNLPITYKRLLDHLSGQRIKQEK
jgi:hypothetical protein